MTVVKTSGQGLFRFFHREDLYNLPSAAGEHEVDLHGGFAVDTRPGYGQIYYGMPAHGIMRIDADLRKQERVGRNFLSSYSSFTKGDRRHYYDRLKPSHVKQ